MPQACRWEGDDLHLVVRVQPRGGADEVAGVVDGTLRIKLSSPPVQGEANRALVKLIAREFRVPQKRVEILSGERGRTKRLRIVEPRVLPAWIPRNVALAKRGAGHG